MNTFIGRNAESERNENEKRKKQTNKAPYGRNLMGTGGMHGR